MYYLANDIVTSIGLLETLIILLALGTCVIHLVGIKSGKPASRFLLWLTWIPLLASLFAALAGLAEVRETVSLLSHQNAVSDAQRDLLFAKSAGNSVRLIIVGFCCTIAIWLLARCRPYRGREQAQ